jgi:hypothetical protein
MFDMHRISDLKPHGDQAAFWKVIEVPFRVQKLPLYSFSWRLRVLPMNLGVIPRGGASPAVVLGAKRTPANFGVHFFSTQWNF